MSPEGRLALECIQEASNREEATLFAVANGYDAIALDDFTVVSENSGWRLDLYEDHIEVRGRFRDVPYDKIKEVLGERRTLPRVS